MYPMEFFQADLWTAQSLLARTLKSGSCFLPSSLLQGAWTPVIMWLSKGKKSDWEYCHEIWKNYKSLLKFIGKYKFLSENRQLMKNWRKLLYLEKMWFFNISNLQFQLIVIYITYISHRIPFPAKASKQFLTSLVRLQYNFEISVPTKSK